MPNFQLQLQLIHIPYAYATKDDVWLEITQVLRLLDEFLHFETEGLDIG